MKFRNNLVVLIILQATFSFSVYFIGALVMSVSGLWVFPGVDGHIEAMLIFLALFSVFSLKFHQCVYLEFDNEKFTLSGVMGYAREFLDKEIYKLNVADLGIVIFISVKNSEKKSYHYLFPSRVSEREKIISILKSRSKSIAYSES